MTSAFAFLLSLLFAGLSGSPVTAAPASPHRHRRHVHQLHLRHRPVIQPVAFAGRLGDMANLPLSEQQRVLNSLRAYLVQHAPQLVERSALPRLPGMGLMDTQQPSLPADKAQMNKLAEEKVQMALTPQLIILKRKLASTHADQTRSLR